MRARRIQAAAFAVLAAAGAVVAFHLTPDTSHGPSQANIAGMFAASSTLSVYVSPSGNDGNACTSASPCATFQRGYNLAQPGQVVEVAGGTYPFQQMVYAPKSSAEPITIRAAAGETVTIGGLAIGQDLYNSTVLAPTNVVFDRIRMTGNLTVWGSADGLTFQNGAGRKFDIWGAQNVKLLYNDWGPARCLVGGDSTTRAGSGKRAPGQPDQPATNILVEGGSIHDQTTADPVPCHVDGMAIFGATNMTVRGVHFYGNEVTNIRVQNNTTTGQAAPNLTLESNWFEAPLQGNLVTKRSDSFDIDNPIPGLIVRQNTLENQTYPDCASGCGTAASPAQIVGNILSVHGTACGYANTVWSYNAENAWGGYGGGGCSSTDRFGGYPALTSDGHLAAVGSADNLVPAAKCAASDIDFQPRPQQDANCDAGADERGAAPPVTTTAPATTTAPTTTAPTTTVAPPPVCDPLCVAQRRIRNADAALRRTDASAATRVKWARAILEAP